jgi:hypothetical protein
MPDVPAKHDGSDILPCHFFLCQLANPWVDFPGFAETSAVTQKFAAQNLPFAPLPKRV